MAEITLEFITRQIERLEDGLDIARRELGRMADDMATIKNETALIKAETAALRADITALRADILTMHGEIAGMRHGIRVAFDTLDAPPLCPLEDIEN